ncbi:MAG: hypothetical protein R2843_13785 [Thermomicrobiales bacterium]
MMGLSQLDLEEVQARNAELAREYRKVQKVSEPRHGESRLRGALRAVAGRI